MSQELLVPTATEEALRRIAAATRDIAPPAKTRGPTAVAALDIA